MDGGPPRYSIDSDPYSEFTWLNPSMIVEQATPDVGGGDRSHESAIAKYHTPSHFDTPSSGQSPVFCGSLQFFNSFSLSPLFHDSSCHLDSDNHVLRNSVRSLDEGEDPIFSLPAAWIAAFGDSGTSLFLCYRQNGRRRLFPLLTSSHPVYRNRKARRRHRCYRS